MNETNIFTEIIAKLNNPAIAWQIMSNYWLNYMFGFGPKYRDYIASPEVDADDRILGEDDPYNEIIGLDPQLTPKQRFNKLIEFWAYCFEMNRQAVNKVPEESRMYVTANTPAQGAAWRRERDPRVPDLSDIDKMVEAGKFRPSYADRIRKMRIQKREREHAQQEDALDFVVSELQGRTTMSLEQMGQMATDGETCGEHYVSEDDMMSFISEERCQALIDQMYKRYEADAARLHEAKAFRSELMADHLFAEDDMLLIADFAS